MNRPKHTPAMKRQPRLFDDSAHDIPKVKAEAHGGKVYKQMNLYQKGPRDEAHAGTVEL